jgi:hypothetical protein
LVTYSQFLQQRLGVPSTEGIQSHFPMSDQTIKRARLVEALRPPFLDGDYVGPIARVRQRMRRVGEWWRNLDRGGSGAKGGWGARSSNQEEEERNLTPSERLRKRFLNLRDQGRQAFSKREDEEEEGD